MQKKGHIKVPFWVSKGPYILLYIVLLLMTWPMYKAMVNRPAQHPIPKQDVAGIRTEVVEQVHAAEVPSIPTPTIYVGE